MPDDDPDDPEDELPDPEVLDDPPEANCVVVVPTAGVEELVVPHPVIPRSDPISAVNPRYAFRFNCIRDLWPIERTRLSGHVRWGSTLDASVENIIGVTEFALDEG